jgi:cysteine desulfurase / selenocysteine lyase
MPLLSRVVHGHQMAYLDSASTSPTPLLVIEAMDHYYKTTHSNVHRAIFTTAEEATALYETSRATVATLLNAASPDEIVFTKNTTEALNLVARSWGTKFLRPGDVVVLTEMDHHANLIPWFQLRDSLGIELRFIPVTDDFRLDLSPLPALLRGAKLLSFTAMSNVTGTINPVALITAAAHDAGALVCVDAAQSVPRMPTNVQDLDVDFLAFSGHKALGPTGIGVLWARSELLRQMPPFLGGGGMIENVSLAGFTPAPPPSRFEAGTPPIAEAVGLAVALRYLESLSLTQVGAHELALTKDLLHRLVSDFSDQVKVIGPSDTSSRGGVVSLDVVGVHPHDAAQVLDQFGVCVRPGHHCAKPLMTRFGLSSTLRVSYGPYSAISDNDVFLESLAAAITMFARP